GRTELTQQVRAILQFAVPVPPFAYPLVAVSLEPNTFFNRRSGDDGFSGETPANAVPNPTEKVHDGAPAVSPWLPSMVRVSGPSTANASPPAIDRASVAAESARPTSLENPSVAVGTPREYAASRSIEPLPPFALNG